jgi:proteasome accessory factor B
MSASKSERLLNLTITLLTARNFVPKERLRQLVEGYRKYTDDLTFNRAFERDKEDLLALGVPLEMSKNVGLLQDEVGYRIRRSDYELPAIEFTADEAAAISLASTVWGSAAQSEQAVRALAKLRAAGLEPDPSRVQTIVPTISAPDESFDLLVRALGDQTQVAFEYRGEKRHVQPWGLACRHGDWYLTGFDTDRQAVRLFKLSRFTKAAVFDGKPGAYERGEVDFDKLFDSFSSSPDAQALVAIRVGSVPVLRRRSHLVADAVVPEGYELYEVEYARGRDFAAELCSYGADVIVIEPQELVNQVKASLEVVSGWVQ